MTRRFPGLFEAFGVELEYMIVDDATLDVLPIADRLLHTRAGAPASDVDCGLISWSNELALHVIELKTTDPALKLDSLADAFQSEIDRANELLGASQARLMPSGMHPWMDPERELRLWPHDGGPIYGALDSVFGCRGHGWANVQSVHLNLPFRDAAEFGVLHEAVRWVLPILPALTASSPVVERRSTGLLDNRLDFYRHHADRIPSVVGGVVPEWVETPEAYQSEVLGRIYHDLAPLDPQGVLRHEWVNARGAIARFDRQTIELRVMDVQECPAMDLALVELVVDVTRSLVDLQLAERRRGGGSEPAVEQGELESILGRCIESGQAARIDCGAYLHRFGWSGASGCTAGALWRHLAGQAFGDESRWSEPLRVVLDEGNLAERIERSLAQGQSLEAVYLRLCDCLAAGECFVAQVN